MSQESWRSTNRGRGGGGITSKWGFLGVANADGGPLRRCQFLGAAVVCRAEGGGAGAGSHDEPHGVAAEPKPKTAALGYLDCGIALTREGSYLGRVVGRVLLRGGKLGLTGAAVLYVVVQGLQVRCRNLGDGGGREFLHLG